MATTKTATPTPDLKDLTLRELALMVKRDWQKPYFGAVPYLNAMMALTSIDEQYGLDTGESIVLYFLANANTWRGETARAVKKELNRRAKAVK
jgi:hypothetical protein